MLESWFSVLRRGLGNIAAAFSMTHLYHYHDTASQKAFSRNIFRKTCNLRNFAFYKFWFSTLTKGLGYFASVYHTMVSLTLHSFSESLQTGQLSQGYIQENLELAKFRILQIFRESRFSTLTKGLGNFATVNHTMASLPWHSFSESLQSRQLSLGKLVICEIFHFTNFNINLVYFPWIKDLTTLQVLMLRMESIWQCSWKKCAIHSLS